MKTVDCACEAQVPRQRDGHSISATSGSRARDPDRILNAFGRDPTKPSQRHDLRSRGPMPRRKTGQPCGLIVIGLGLRLLAAAVGPWLPPPCCWACKPVKERSADTFGAARKAP